MSAAGSDSLVLQLRVVVEADDYETAVSFYRDALGLPEQAAYQGRDDARVVILNAGRATLELANPSPASARRIPACSTAACNASSPSCGWLP
jgi:catechol 2,3-dioxygenase-like lactoylglutathione lyase family enzyme